MAIVMRMRWDGVTAEQYAAAAAKVQWETKAPTGGMFHVAWFEKDAMNIVDVWHSAEEFQRFVDERLMPVVKGEMNLPGEPVVEISETYRIFDARAGEVVDA